MGVHRECGVEIVWPKREDDPERYGRPLEFAGPAYIITEQGYAIQVLTYKHHECDPDVMEAWLERCRRVEALLQEEQIPAASLAYETASKDRLEGMWAGSLKVECPRCMAKKKKKCISLAKYEHGRILKRPHPARVKLAEEEGHYF